METLITFETAELAKMKNFDVQTYSDCWVQTFDGGIIHKKDTRDCSEHDRAKQYMMQPSQAVLQKWLREKHRVVIQVVGTIGGYGQIVNYYFQIIYEDEVNNNLRYLPSGYDKSIESYSVNEKSYHKYEDALESGLQEALKLISEKPHETN